MGFWGQSAHCARKSDAVLVVAAHHRSAAFCGGVDVCFWMTCNSPSPYGPLPPLTGRGMLAGDSSGNDTRSCPGRSRLPGGPDQSDDTGVSAHSHRSRPTMTLPRGGCVGEPRDGAGGGGGGGGDGDSVGSRVRAAWGVMTGL